MNSDHHQQLQGQELGGGRYVIKQPLHAGGMATVWLATDRYLRDDVVVKFPHAAIFFDNAFRKRFQREIANLIGLSRRHAGIVDILEVGEHQGVPYLIMPYLRRGSLKQWGKNLEKAPNKRDIKWHKALRWLEEIADALDFVHRDAKVHRDVKPHNILFDDGGRAQLAGFGIMKSIAEGDAELTQQLSGAEQTVGALPYMAHEVLIGEPFDGRADQYSLAVTLYEALSGKRPYSGNSLGAITKAQLHGHSQSLFSLCPFLPHDVSPVVARALSIDPDERYESCSSFAGAMLDCLYLRPTDGEAIASAELVGDGTVAPTRIGAAEPIRSGEVETSSVALPPRAPSTPRSSPPPALSRSHGHHDEGLVQKTDVGTGAELIHENAQFSIYRPLGIVPNRWYSLLAFAHSVDALEKVEEQAKRVLGEQMTNYLQPLVEDASKAVPRGSRLTFLPEVEGIEFSPPQQSFSWLEPVHLELFSLRASDNTRPGIARGRVTVLMGAMILADVALSIRVGAEKTGGAPERARPYRKIFASYSRKDSAVVDECERFAAALGDQYLRDCVQLRAGESWNERLLEMIEDADIFQLFWSWESMRSPHCRREWEFALSLDRPQFIRPIYWQEPRPEDRTSKLPPASLDRLHFQKLDAPISRRITDARTTRTRESVCPRCWNRFAVSDTEDRIVCSECDLLVPNDFIDLTPIFVSVVGAPTSGKTSFVTSMSWQLRRLLPMHFHYSFTDADVGLNALAIQNERDFFMRPSDEPARKQEIDESRGQQMFVLEAEVSHGLPYVYSLRPSPLHPNYRLAHAISCALCVYDTAGHLLPDHERLATAHLEHADAIIFVFDPTQHLRFRDAREGSTTDPQFSRGYDEQTIGQERVLIETLNRLRQSGMVSQHERGDKLLIVLLSKYDAWASRIRSKRLDDPWVQQRDDWPASLDSLRIHRISERLRELMLDLAPEVVSAIDEFSSAVTYMPSSALGRRVEADASGKSVLPPTELKPMWAEVPILHILSRMRCGMIPRIR